MVRISPCTSLYFTWKTLQPICTAELPVHLFIFLAIPMLWLSCQLTTKFQSSVLSNIEWLLWTTIIKSCIHFNTHREFWVHPLQHVKINVNWCYTTVMNYHLTCFSCPAHGSQQVHKSGIHVFKIETQPACHIFQNSFFAPIIIFKWPSSCAFAKGEY